MVGKLLYLSPRIGNYDFMCFCQIQFSMVYRDAGELCSHSPSTVIRSKSKLKISTIWLKSNWCSVKTGLALWLFSWALVLHACRLLSSRVARCAQLSTRPWYRCSLLSSGCLRDMGHILRNKGHHWCPLTPSVLVTPFQPLDLPLPRFHFLSPLFLLFTHNRNALVWATGPNSNIWFSLFFFGDPIARAKNG